MNLIGVPVPPGFTITTDVCTLYYKEGRDQVVELIREEVEAAVKNVEEIMGTKFGDKENPCLLICSFRSKGFHAGNDGYSSQFRFE